jgi:SAM-dependent methyltransferase
VSTAFDGFYVRFEDRFRGSRAQTTSRLLEYLPLLAALKDGQAGPLRALDLGSGRGEWLEVLRDHGWEASGVDQNQEMVARSVERGLEVLRGDVLESLRRLPDCCLLLVTAFHLVEHVAFETLLQLVEQARRVLQPGGVLLFETPNPENLQVGSHTFYLDPTHVRPLPPGLLAFVLQDAAFGWVELLRLHPYDEIALAETDPPVDAVDHAVRLHFGPQDYAVIGLKVDAGDDPRVGPMAGALGSIRDSVRVGPIPDALRAGGTAARAARAEHRAAVAESRAAAAELRAASAETRAAHAEARAGEADARAAACEEGAALAESRAAAADSRTAAALAEAAQKRARAEQLRADAERERRRGELAEAHLAALHRHLLWRVGAPVYRGIRALFRSKRGPNA